MYYSTMAKRQRREVNDELLQGQFDASVVGSENEKERVDASETSEAEVQMDLYHSPKF